MGSCRPWSCPPFRRRFTVSSDAPMRGAASLMVTQRGTATSPALWESLLPNNGSIVSRAVMGVEGGQVEPLLLKRDAPEGIDDDRTHPCGLWQRPSGQPR